MLMLGAYGWAFVHPLRKLYYNMTITAVSVAIALVVGGIEILGLLRNHGELHGRWGDWIGSLNEDYHFRLIGVVIIGIFVTCWATSAILYRYLGYHRLELPGE
jgi:high-affinity nickel-transport protein